MWAPPKGCAHSKPPPPKVNQGRGQGERGGVRPFAVPHHDSPPPHEEGLQVGSAERPTTPESHLGATYGAWLPSRFVYTWDATSYRGQDTSKGWERMIGILSPPQASCPS